MATLTRDNPRDYGMESKVSGAAPVIASDIIFEGAAVGESASTGTVRPLQGADTFMGFAFRKADNALGLVGAIKVELVVKGVVELPIAGLVLADVGRTVLASDDDTFTFSTTGNTNIGKVVELVAAGRARVAFEALRYASL